ncbi:MAG: histidine ammonia-lyase [Planctomycetes bacterium]|nr:histidine ammonia-lyase [Planctomycetota bacterium]MCB9870848.1 histidine ammonia-lyase [Planctomycetota bacterium]
MKTIAVGSDDLSLDQLVTLSRPGAMIRIPRPVHAALARSRKVVEEAVRSGKTVYGVNTGFGKLAGVSVEAAKLEVLQRNLILSHATGVGEPLDPEVCRLALALRIHNLARGFSGVRLQLLDVMVRLFNADLIPVLPSQGSVGASGDLAPLAHMALPLLGQGEVYDGGRVGRTKRLAGRAALRRISRAPVALAAKEGLALINGTQVMTAIGVLAVARARDLNLIADIACATTVEALRASERPFVAKVHQLRPHPGQARTAANLRSLLHGSKVMLSHRTCGKVQDAYSIRCSPQVHGAAKDAWRFAADVLVTEASSVTDNPLVFPDGDVVSAGNFHGQPVSQALDFLAISVSTLANISERRIENLVNPDISGLPPFLAHQPGLESGLMISQVVAAALASENKSLAHPASVDTIPTSANREDHVSMGVTAARHAAQVVANSETVVAIELLCAAQGLDCGEPLAPGRGVAAAHAKLRESVRPLDRDRYLAPDIAATLALVRGGGLLDAVRGVPGVSVSC